MKNFQELDLLAPIQRALNEEGYLTPTPIQAKTLPHAIEGRDVLGCAQTGTGKTAAFALPALDWLGEEHCKPHSKRPLALVLAPTRELAIQISDSFSTYGRYLPLRVSTVYGGVGQGKQVSQLKRGAHILVATPGRLLDLMGQGHVHLDKLEVFVLDEADRMLDMGFLQDLKRIIRELPEERQSLFFSATLPPNIKTLAKQLLYDPINVTVTPESVSVAKIDQRVMLVERAEKQGLLKELLTASDMARAIVFTKTKRGANRLSEKLERSGIQCATIHGNKSQAARQKALAAFRDSQVNVLVATDVAARGIDIDGVSHVINFDLPHEPESYVHRIGRTGRAGADGVAVSLCLPDETRELQAIEKLIGKKVSVVRQRARQKTASESSKPRNNRRSMSKGTATLGNPKRNQRQRRKSDKPGVAR